MADNIQQAKQELARREVLRRKGLEQNSKKTGLALGLERAGKLASDVVGQAPLIGSVVAGAGSEIIPKLIPPVQAAEVVNPILPKARRVLFSGLGGAKGEEFKQEFEKQPVKATVRAAADVVQPIVPFAPTLAGMIPKPETTDVEKQKQIGTGAGLATLDALGETIFPLFGKVGNVIGKKVFPRAKAITKTILKTLPDDFTNFLIKQKGVASDSVKFLKEKGTENVKRIAGDLTDNIDDFFVRLKTGVQTKIDDAGKSQKAVFDNVPSDRSFNINEFIIKSKKRLASVGRVTKTGKPSATGRQIKANALDEVDDILNNLSKRQQTGFDIGTGKLSKKQTVDVSRKGLGGTFEKKVVRTNVNKEELKLLRDRLQALRSNANPSEKRILTDIVNNLVDAGENQGAAGWRAAQKKYTQAKTLEKEFLNSYGDVKGVNQGTIKDYFKASKVNKDKLSRLATELGDETLENELKIVSANKSLQKAEQEFSDDKILSTLKGLLDDDVRVVAKTEKTLKHMFGDKAESIIKQVSNVKTAGKLKKVVGVTAGLGAAGGTGKAIFNKVAGKKEEETIQLQ